jgi:tRNA (guanine26-N2/guanine27-N2)-dimethyltransferase
MWSAPLHDAEFVAKVLGHVEANKSLYGTAARMRGMLTLAKEAGFLIIIDFCILNIFETCRQELPVHFYFTPSRVASFFHCETPSLDDVA